MTEKLYYSNPTCIEWQTAITSITEEGQYYFLTLKETAFYPEGGGQPADQGYIGDLEVLDVIERNSEVFHKVTSKPNQSNVHCKINWNRRFDHMQQHTGQHLLSAVIIELYNSATTSFHLGEDTVTIDISMSEIKEKQLLNIERKVNEYIYENKEIKTYYVTEKELATLPLRKLPDVTEDIRIVEIDGIDLSACCGTHVKSTGELGLIKLVKTEKQRGNIRIHFKCGYRALEDYHQSSTILNEISNYLSSNREAVLLKIKKMETENKALQKEIETLKEENDRLYIECILAKEETSFITLSFHDRTMKDMQRLARLLTEQNKIILFCSTNEYKLLVAHNKSVDFDCGQFFKQELKNYKGKGGGNATSAQAGFETLEDMKTFQAYIEKVINEKLVVNK